MTVGHFKMPVHQANFVNLPQRVLRLRSVLLYKCCIVRIDAGSKPPMIKSGGGRSNKRPGLIIQLSTLRLKETKMKSVTMQMLSRFMILAMLSLSFQTASAGIIGTDKAAVAATAQADRAVIVAALSRGDVANQLQAQGVDPMLAQQRVASMTDQEARTLANSIATAPAGADATFLLLLAVGAGIWYFMYRK